MVHLERFWAVDGGPFELTRTGWLAEPVADGFFVRNTDLIPTSELAGRRCLVLLGEPGIGKSTTLANAGTLVEDSSSVTSLSFDLGEFASEDRLTRRVFEHPEVQAWRSAPGVLCLTLDGFDEAHARIETLPRLLISYLREWDCSRLYVRLICRTADWPTSLAEPLQQAFGEVSKCELMPLRRADAGNLLRARAGLGEAEAEAVLTAIEAANLVPLAARPLTLGLLEAAQQADGALPVSTAALYERGLLALADETTPTRRDSSQGRVRAEARLVVAKRLAAASIFGSRPVIWLGSSTEGTIPGDLTLDEIVRLPSAAVAETWPSTVQAVTETLHSGLFRGAGDKRATWAHATFADYLSARWVLDGKLDYQQIRSLLFADDGCIHVRCRQVAAWLVRIAPSRFGHFLSVDPEAFLTNIDLPDDSLRHQLIDAIFLAAANGELFYDYDWQLSSLAHPALGDQLSAALSTGDHNRQRIAITMARQCDVRVVVPDLIAIALSPSPEPYIRTAAAMAVYDLTTDAPTDALLPLVWKQGAPPHSEDEVPNELEGAALLASWPHALPSSAVFSRLNPRHKRNFSGVYSIFLHDFARGLNSSDLEAACAWLRQDPSSRLADGRLDVLVNAVIRLCIANLDEQSAKDTLRAVMRERAAHHEPLFGNDSLDHEAQLTEADRRALIPVLLEGADEDAVLNLVDVWNSRREALIKSTDFVWMSELHDASPERLQLAIRNALTQLYDPSNTNHSSVVLGLEPEHPIAELFAYWRSVIALNSPEADYAREQWREFHERRDRRRRPAKDAWVNPQIIELARRAAAGDTKAFWYGTRLITVRPGTQSYFDEFRPDLSTHPRWDTLPAETRAQFLEASPIFLATASCDPDSWLAQDLTSFVATAAYRALILLLREDADQLTQLDPRVWKEWAPILVDWVTTINGAKAEDKTALLRLAVPHARAELESALLCLIDKAVETGDHLFRREELAILMSDGLANELITRLEAAPAAKTREDLLDALTDRHSHLVMPLLRRWLAEDERAMNPERAHGAVLRLLHGRTREAWPDLVQLMAQDPGFVKDALEVNNFAHDYRPPDLDEMDLADLYIWVSRQFPHREDPQHDDAHWVGPREALATWRDGLLETLKAAGTSDAVDSLVKISEAFPERTWLPHTLAAARLAYRDATWEPLSLRDLDALADHSSRRVVRTDADLMRVTLEALANVQDSLQGDTPQAHLLWDTHSGRPKTEDQVSDYLASELSKFLGMHTIVVNREVQVRRSRPVGGLPERTDLRVETVRTHAAGPSRVLAIPGEVKGNWNRAVVNSLESQLVDRYMADIHTAHGLYIVAWFDQASWTATDDHRRRDAAKWKSRDEIRSALVAESDRLAQRGHQVSIVVLDCSLTRDR